MRINRYTVTIISFFSFLAFMVLNKMGLFSLGVLALMVLAVASVLFVPYLYRKKLNERAPKSLRSFVMSDPELRQAIKPEAQPEPKPTSHENLPGQGPEIKT